MQPGTAGWIGRSVGRFKLMRPLRRADLRLMRPGRLIGIEQGLLDPPCDRANEMLLAPVASYYLSAGLRPDVRWPLPWLARCQNLSAAYLRGANVKY